MNETVLHIVLVNPLIPQNTGSIARLSAASSCELHLIEPLGFELSDRYLKRAGLDYWSEVRLTVHKDWEAFRSAVPIPEDRIHLFTKFAEASYTEIRFARGDAVVFGAETTGLPPELHERYDTQRYRIPIDNPKVRSINLSNAVGIAVYEARRQFGL